MKNRPLPHTPPWALRERAQKVLHTPSSSLPKPKDATDAFRVLFELASSPDTAGDALALLHELQVHQVELDMQTEELMHSRAELETDHCRLERACSCEETSGACGFLFVTAILYLPPKTPRMQAASEISCP
jgi:hypothetical protein